jgi:aminoglycoside phosphotransferase (APT) family kinase protein
VLQIINTLGQELGYAKIGCNQHTTRSIRNEASALRKLQGVNFSDAIVPAVLHAATVGERYLLIQSSCGAKGRSTTKLSWKLVRFLAELHQMEPSHGKLPVPDKNRIEILRRGGFHYYAHVLDWAREYADHFGSVPFGPLHGDFTSWNVRHMRGKFAVYDWECFQSSAPAAWDLFHYIVASRVEIEDCLPGRIYRDITGTGETADLVREYFRLIGATEDLIAPLLASYAAESLAESASDFGGTAGRKDRMLQRTWATLLGLICCGSREALDQAICVQARGAS